MHIPSHNYRYESETAGVSLRCPKCHHLGILAEFGNNAKDLRLWGAEEPSEEDPAFYVGHRFCPNRACSCYICIIYTENEEGEFRLVLSYPPERIDYDSSNLPVLVIKSLEEAITCHANQCYVAAAIMLRKTLEVVCKEKGATGSTLFAKIQGLCSQVVMPANFVEGLHDIRLLGNDAAHIEAESYNEVGEEEVRAALFIVKMILQFIYQMDEIMAQLKALKAIRPSP